MTGNLASSPTNPLFLLDESLTPPVARALEVVGYNFTTVETVFGHKGVLDPEIITWCQKHEAIWVHADDRSKKEHKKPLLTSGIRTLWVYRTQGQMSGKEQLRILAFVLPDLIQRLQQKNAPRHFKASVGAANPLAKPSLRPISI